MKITLILLLLSSSIISGQNLMDNESEEKNGRNIVYKYNNGTIEWYEIGDDKKIVDQGNNLNILYHPYFGENKSPIGFEESSPSITKDGKTIIFARYKDWDKKVPYVGKLINGNWRKEKLDFIDTLYNLTISPDGNQIVYSKEEKIDTLMERKTFYVKKERGNWGTPKEIRQLSGISAGYFQVTENGKMYFFARKPKEGIYYVELNEKGECTNPKWLSDNVSLEESSSFDILMHPNEDKLIITQYYGEEKFKERGQPGIYYYEKKGEVWNRIKRLPINYGWGGEITKNRELIFVRNGNLQFVNLNQLGISW